MENEMCILNEALRKAMKWVEPLPYGAPLRKEYESDMEFIQSALCRGANDDEGTETKAP